MGGLQKRGMMMWLKSDEQVIIDLFWDLVGEVEPFPRSLERPIALALPIAVIKMPRLALTGIENWLRLRHINYSFKCENRFVRGCLIAHGGKGFIFCDGSDSAEEIRFTLAHEVGHFLADYLFPRQKAVRKFGEEILNVFDGIRPATVTERVHSIFESTKIGVMSDLMDRQVGSELTLSIEDKADKIGFALLAPPQEAIKGLEFSQRQYSERVEMLSDRLTSVFGLPQNAVKMYAHSLLKSIGKGPSWAEALKIS